ncbi:efflux RND transporter periplasmic adaptor subunit [Thiohalorhabdus methylotrophus]|uniref:Efflux RND transporter periplasmic adaptor subunit n=1 Tax=Thiohalorhabdus methylotrophus TaxID=3242694 RepID=A0ABV4TS71_9GAMM
MASLRWLRTYLPPILILLAGGGLFAVLVATRPEPPAQEEQESVWVVDAKAVSPRSQSPTLSLYGRLESPREATRAAAVAADVEEVAVREGHMVEKGALLVRLEAGDLRDQLAQRRADLAEIKARIAEAKAEHRADEAALEERKALVDLAKRAVDRAEKLAGRDLGSQAEVDAAREARRRAELELVRQRLQVENFPALLNRLEAQRKRVAAQVAQAQRDLSRTRVEAPFRARITGVEVSPGDRVRPGDALVSLYDPGALEVRATIPASDVGTVRRALEAGREIPAEVQVDGRTLRALLDRFGGRSPQEAGGVEALFRVRDEAPAELPLGRFAELTVEMPARKRVAAVPYSALYDHDRIYVVRDGRMVGMAVERVGQRAVSGGPNLALVRAPQLREGDRVVTTQLPTAMEGLRVRVQDSREPARAEVP